MSQEPTFSPDSGEARTKRFHDDAVAYCRFIDRFCAGEVKDPYTTLEQLLANLAASVLQLPFDLASGEVAKVERASWESLAKGVGTALAPTTPDFFEYFKDDSNGLVATDMLDDHLTDIYVDLKQGIDHFSRGDRDNMGHAAWHWRYSYESHWGDHLFQAMKTVHLIRYQLLWS